MTDPVARLALDPAAAAARITQSPFAPGVGVAGVVGGAVTTATVGVAEDWVYRPGSITKLLTATLLAQCAEDGLVDLDAPATKYAPLTGEPTLRHLITHASGLDAGDLFVDTGDGDDAVARYVDRLRDVGFLFAPGATFAYCNGGFVLAGHIVSLVRDMTWEDAMRTHLFGPLGMDESGFAPLATADYTVRALGPAGGTLTSSPRDLGRFLADHLARPERAWMRDLAVRAPGGVARMHGAGAGWMVWEGSRRIGGANPGVSGYLAASDDAAVGLVALTTGEQGVNAVGALLDADLPEPPSPGPPPTGDALGALAGEYASHAMRVQVEVADDALAVTLNGMRAPLTPRDAFTFDSLLGPVAFFDGLVRWRMRVLRRVN